MRPPIDKEFSHLQHHWSNQLDIMVVRIRPGEIFASKSPNHVILTTLGSCISACIQDTKKGIGGMNHFMLPNQDEGNINDTVHVLGTYGNHAMELLINSLIKRGGERRNFELKLFGGGNIGSGAKMVSENNIDFITSYAKNEQLNLKSIDLGGSQPRKVIFFPFSGIVKVKRLKALDVAKIEAQERTFIEKTADNVKTDDIELF